MILCSFQIILRINNRKNWWSTNTNGELFNRGKGLGRACKRERACKQEQACKQERVLRIHCIEHQQRIHCIHQRCKLQFVYGRQVGERSIFRWLQRHLCKCNEMIIVRIFEIDIRFENKMFELIPTEGPHLRWFWDLKKTAELGTGEIMSWTTQ